MQTLPPTASGLIVACVCVIAIVVAAACGLGSSSRVLGIHLPYVARNETTWVRGHRSALWIVIPSCAAGIVLALAPDESLLSAGWLAWGVGVVGGALVAMLRAQQLVKREPS